MISYAAHQTSPHGPRGIASYPWEWLVDYKPITYLNVNPAHPVPGLYHVHPAVHFTGFISPPILLLALPGMAMAGMALARVEAPRQARWRPASDRGAAVVAIAWFSGTLLPFVALSLIWRRTSYLYYMLIVMPGLYLVTVWLLARLRSRPRLIALWAVTVIAAAVIAYPLTPLP
jgi:hypothetical protein